MCKRAHRALSTLSSRVLCANGQAAENGQAVPAAILDAQKKSMADTPDGIVSGVIKAVDTLLKEWYPHLKPLWAILKEAKHFGPTRKFILDEWNSLVDLLAVTCKGRRTTKEATNFTLARFQRWEGTLRRWMGDDATQRVLYSAGVNPRDPVRSALYTGGVERPERGGVERRKHGGVERRQHELCGILNQVDEVCTRLLVDGRSLTLQLAGGGGGC